MSRGRFLQFWVAKRGRLYCYTVAFPLYVIYTVVRFFSKLLRNVFFARFYIPFVLGCCSEFLIMVMHTWRILSAFTEVLEKEAKRLFWPLAEVKKPKSSLLVKYYEHTIYLPWTEKSASLKNQWLEDGPFLLGAKAYFQRRTVSFREDNSSLLEFIENFDF